MKIPLLVLVGPTAVGKTNMAIKLAQRLHGEIISADSRQVYRYMDIGTAKPTLAEREGVAHHLLDIIYPDEKFSVADYQRLAQKAIYKVWKGKKLPILAGGTGFYVNAVIDNYNFSTTAINREYRQQLRRLGEEKGGKFLLDRLARVDSVAAGRLHPHDLRRIIRALEVYEFTGRPLSQWEEEQERDSPYHLCMIGLIMERALLYERINRRVDAMLVAGLVDEVWDLLQRGYSPSLNSMQGLGYKEIIPYLKGKMELAEAVAILKRDTRRFAKRQLTWFRRDERISWFSITGDGKEELLEDIAGFAQGILQQRANMV